MRSSVRCQGSSYLVHCRDCVDCTYCFGCVGLIKKEFHILNVRYPRNAYFELTAKLEQALKARNASAGSGAASRRAPRPLPTEE